jgi:hypothetical protein
MSLGIGFNPADIVDTEPAINNNLLYFLNTNYAGVIDFEGAAGNVTAVVNREDKRVKNRSVFRIERTIDEDVVLVRGHASVIPTARRERVCCVRVDVLDSSVAAVNDQASPLAFCHRLAKLHGVFLARELLSRLASSACGHCPPAGFRDDVQSADDVANLCQLYVAGLGRGLYFSFLRLHQWQITIFHGRGKLGASG